MRTVLAAACLAAWSTLSLAAPAVDDPLGAARAEADERGRLLLIEGGAAWCGGCVRMQSETWPDAGLKAWLGERAVVVHLDADEHPEALGSVGITGFPTLVLERDGVELDRVSGFQSPNGLRSWIESAQRGVTQVQRMRERAARAPAREQVFIRYRLLIELQVGGRWIEAAQECVTLWELTRDPTDESYVRRMRAEDLPHYMKSIAPRDPEARRLIAALSPWPGHDAPPTDADPGEIDDWIAIEAAVDEAAGPISWARAAVDDADAIAATRSQPRLFGLLVEAEEWATAGAVLPDQLGWWRGTLSELDRLVTLQHPTDRDRNDLRTLRRVTPGKVAQRVRALRAAARPGEADALEHAALRAWESPAAMRDALE